MTFKNQLLPQRKHNVPPQRPVSYCCFKASSEKHTYTVGKKISVFFTLKQVVNIVTTVFSRLTKTYYHKTFQDSNPKGSSVAPT
jgi:hypothetical protein